MEPNNSTIHTRLSLILKYLESSRIFADILCYYLNKYPHPQKKLASALSVDTSAITHWRRNRRIPDSSAMIFNLSRELALERREKQRLLMAWTIQRHYWSLAGYVQEAIEKGDETDLLVEDLVHFLYDALDNVEDMTGD